MEYLSHPALVSIEERVVRNGQVVRYHYATRVGCSHAESPIQMGDQKFFQGVFRIIYNDHQDQQGWCAEDLPDTQWRVAGGAWLNNREAMNGAINNLIQLTLSRQIEVVDLPRPSTLDRLKHPRFKALCEWMGLSVLVGATIWGAVWLATGNTNLMSSFIAMGIAYLMMYPPPQRLGVTYHSATDAGSSKEVVVVNETQDDNAPQG